MIIKRFQDRTPVFMSEYFVLDPEDVEELEKELILVPADYEEDISDEDVSLKLIEADAQDRSIIDMFENRIEGPLLLLQKPPIVKKKFSIMEKVRKEVVYKLAHPRFPFSCPRCHQGVFRRVVSPNSVLCCILCPFLGWLCAYSLLEYRCRYCGEVWEHDDVRRYAEEKYEIEQKLSTHSEETFMTFVPQHFK
jgi:hypothetical protein